MNIADINWLAVAVSSVVFFMIEGIWFGPKTFYPAWQKAMGRNPDEVNGSELPMGALFGSTFVASLVQVFTLAVVIELAIKADPSFGLAQGALTGFLVSLGLVAASSLSHRLFAHKKAFTVWIIEVSADVVALTIAGVILAVWQ
ncbi:MAG: hypothetical protein RLZZ229_528 [Actinomycetota bacterium]|jgi:hypothetical protein